MPPAPTLRLDPRPSRVLASALVLTHALACAAAWVSLSGWLRYLVCGAILASLAQALRRTLHPALSLELNEDGRVSWRNRDGTWHEGRLGGSHFVSAGFAVLKLEIAGLRRKRVILMADSVPPEDFRRLRVWLRWRRNTAHSEPQ
jgi:Membrane-bound toxin component of toxin-antitoxin system